MTDITDAGPRLRAMNDALEGLPCVSTSCPRCGLTFSEAVDSSSFSADEIRAVKCAANALRVAATRVASYDDRRDIELVAGQIEAMLVRLGVTL